MSDDCAENAPAIKARYQYLLEKIQKFGDKMYTMVDRKFRDALQIVTRKNGNAWRRQIYDGSEDRIRRAVLSTQNATLESRRRDSFTDPILRMIL
jgi:hypothetical protein